MNYLDRLLGLVPSVPDKQPDRQKCICGHAKALHRDGTEGCRCCGCFVETDLFPRSVP